MTGTILIVEDDTDTANLVEMYLKRDSYKVLKANDGMEGLRLAQEARPDLIVLDLMLPGMDGMKICGKLRDEGMEVPIIMLTARVEEDDRLNGLDAGADDYMTKPFSPRELAARVRAVLRRTARDASDFGPDELVYEDIRVDMHSRVLNTRGEQLHLTPVEFRLLTLFMKNPGRAFTRDYIIDRVFGYDFDGFDRTVDTHVSNLRSKVEPDPAKPRYINTVYGVGYRFGSA
jgi:DNA-binding response OmpR family regulator